MKTDNGKQITEMKYMGKGFAHKNKIWKILLYLALLAYVVKNIFVGADVDEGYGIMVGYRLAMGDKLLLEMWEPHQTSAIFTALFIRPFLWISKGNVDFLNIYLRVMYFVIHSVIAWFMYHTFRKCKPDAGAKLAKGLAYVFFVCSPKSIFVPEYSNLHIWFMALLCLTLMWYFCAQSPLKGRLWLLVVAGFCLTCDVLAYPSMALLLPFCLIVPAYMKRNKFWKECLAFVAPFLLCAAAFAGYILSYMSVEQILQVIPYVLGDGSHQQGVADKLLGYLTHMGVMGLQLLGCAAVAWGLTGLWTRVRKSSLERESRISLFLVHFFGVHVVVMFYTWFTHVYNASYTRLLYIGIALTGIYCYHKTGRREKTGLYLILLSVVNYCAVLVLSNWTPDLLAPYFVMGALGGLLCWNVYFAEYSGKLCKDMVSVLCGILAFSCCFGYCFRIIGGELTPSTIFEIRGYNRDGFRKGILANYMTAYRYNSNQELWAEAVPDGSTLMYVGMSQFSYMHGDCTVAVPSTISTPTYDETLLAYWEMNPDRYPDVVAIESSYGDIAAVEQEEFLMQWLEEEFEATEVIDYPYVRIYRR